MVSADLRGKSALKSSMQSSPSAKRSRPMRLMAPVVSNFRIVGEGTPERAANVSLVKLLARRLSRANSPS